MKAYLILPLFLLPLEAQSALNFTASPLTGGGISIIGTGSGEINSAGTDNSWEVRNFLPDFLVNSVSDFSTDSSSATGLLTNLTTSQMLAVNLLNLDRDPGSGDDLTFETDGSLVFNAGDSFELSLSATFDSGSALSFSDLIPGVHTAETPQFGSAAIFGPATLTVVPEPSSTGLLILGSGLLLGLRRQRKHP